VCSPIYVLAAKEEADAACGRVPPVVRPSAEMRLCQIQLLSSQSQCITEGETELMSTNIHGHTHKACMHTYTHIYTVSFGNRDTTPSLCHTHTHAHTLRLLPVSAACCASSFSPFPSQICFRLAPLPTALACQPLCLFPPPSNPALTHYHIYSQLYMDTTLSF